MEHLKIRILNGPHAGTIEAMFNPTEYTSTLIANYKHDNAGNPQFLGTKAGNLTINLFFDSYEAKADVREDHLDSVTKRLICGTRRFTNLVFPDVPGQERQTPPLCCFSWGRFEYKGVVSQITQTFTMFLESGIPVRARMSVTFEPRFDAKALKKAFGLEACRKFHEVRLGERLDIIAYKELKDPALWREIARENRIETPMSFPTEKDIGRILIIPDIHDI